MRAERLHLPRTCGVDREPGLIVVPRSDGCTDPKEGYLNEAGAPAAGMQLLARASGADDESWRVMGWSAAQVISTVTESIFTFPGLKIETGGTQSS